MPVSHEKKLIFVHIPKTGGTSIENALGIHGNRSDVGIIPYVNQFRDFNFLFGQNLQHLTLKEIFYNLYIQRFNSYSSYAEFKHKIDLTLSFLPFKNKHIFSDYFVFSIIRNPYDRVVSYFSWLNGKWVDQQPIKKKDFENYVLKILKSGKTSLPKTLKEQYLFVTINGEIKTDFILRFESLEHDFEKLCRILNLNCRLNHRMKSKHDHFSKYYSDITQEIVYNVYKQDFELFQYSKEIG